MNAGILFTRSDSPVDHSTDRKLVKGKNHLAVDWRKWCKWKYTPVASILEEIDTWVDDQYSEIIVIAGMMKEAAVVANPPGYSQMKIYYQVESTELDQVKVCFEISDREAAVVHLRNAVNYIHLAYYVQWMEKY